MSASQINARHQAEPLVPGGVVANGSSPDRGRPPRSAPTAGPARHRSGTAVRNAPTAASSTAPQHADDQSRRPTDHESPSADPAAMPSSFGHAESERRRTDPSPSPSGPTPGRARRRRARSTRCPRNSLGQRPRPGRTARSRSGSGWRGRDRRHLGLGEVAWRRCEPRSARRARRSGISSTLVTPSNGLFSVSRERSMPSCMTLRGIAVQYILPARCPRPRPARPRASPPGAPGCGRGGRSSRWCRT